jgi:pimeloyl-ACP methyl ester carboxylesterase
MSEQELLQAGISAIKSGDRRRASTILAQLVKEYPRSERGWYLLGMYLTAPDQREYCFKRVLEINPNNFEARKQLSPLFKPQPASPPPAQTPPPSAPEQTPKKVQPFLPYEEAEQTPEQPAIFHPPAPQKVEKQQAPAKKKKDNKLLTASIIAGVAIVLAVSTAALFMLYRSYNQPLSPAPQNQIPPTFPPAITATSTEVLPTVLPTALPTVAYTPLYEEAPCQFDTPLRVRVTCGYVTVPEDRSGDPSRTIRLAVAIFHSTSRNPSPDPVIFLQGGPGAAAIEFSANAYPYIVEPFLSERDFVTFDQRGTGYSDPALKCDEMDRVFRQDIYGSIEHSTREMVYQNALISCGGLLRSNGADLNNYSTTESAADLKDIVNLLGYQKVNLYGGSYGTRLALIAMRDHPEIVRTAILDSVVPVDSSLVVEYPNSIKYTLNRLFQACAADPSCNRAYPDLETVFWDLVKDLDANPVTVTTSAYPIGTVTETMDGYYLMSVVMGLTKSSQYINTAPQTIYRVKGQDYSLLFAAQYSLPYAFDGINHGLYVSMICREHVLVTTEDHLREASEQINVNHPLWRPFYGNFEDMQKACKSWGITGPNLGENDAVVSDIPTLVIEGAYDSATPPAFGKKVAENLPNSFYFEFPHLGHTPTTSDPSRCAMRIVLDFLSRPIVEPDRTCLNTARNVEFLVPYTGEPAIQLKERRTFGVTLKVPQEWYYDSGFFVRYSSPVDITQVGAFRLFVSVQDLKDYFSSSAYGYRGLDHAPIETGVRQANGLTWKLYYATSNGRPVDVAATQVGGASLVIVMFSHPDEHDALYRTVFLPMVDSAK